MTVSPKTFTLLIIVLSMFPFMLFSYVTVYIAVIVLLSPEAKSSICKSFIPTNSSVTNTFVKPTLPVFVTVIEYSITSPTLTSASFPMLNPSLVISLTSFTISISAVGTSSVFVEFPPTVAVFSIFPFTSVTSTTNSLDTSSPAGTSTAHFTSV